jgi:hypothetical protein
MGEPVTTGMMIGAALGGGSAAIKGQDPLKAALIGGATGGVTGGISGGFMGGSSSPFSLGSILNGIGTNITAGGDPAKGLAMNAAVLAGSGGGFNPLSGGNYGSVGTAGQTAGQAASGGGSYIGGGFEPSLGGFGQGVMESLKSANKFMNANPTTSQIGFSLAKDALTPEQLQYAPQGQIQRGQIQPMDYMSLLNPQNQSVMRPQPISLLG